MNIDNMIEVLQAYKDGKVIEFRLVGEGWNTKTSATFDFMGRFEYRIKKKTGKEILLGLIENVKQDSGLTLLEVNEIVFRIKGGSYDDWS